MSETRPSGLHYRRIAILGIGLLGGSVAKALRRVQPDVHVVGWSRRESTSDEALHLGVIDEVAASPAKACQDCDVVVVAAPVDRIASLAIQALDASPESCLITDVGSTKATIVDQVAIHPLATTKFVAAHPIAGREKSGVAHALESLFDSRCVILTPQADTKPCVIDKAHTFWQACGAKTMLLDAKQHDEYLAATSHVPHLVAAALARLLTDEAKPLVGSGWLDTTRVAAGDPEMWNAICRENREAISNELRRFDESIHSLRHFIDSADDAQLLIWLAEAKMIRESAAPSPR